MNRKNIVDFIPLNQGRNLVMAAGVCVCPFLAFKKVLGRALFELNLTDIDRICSMRAAQHVVMAYIENSTIGHWASRIFALP